MIKKGILSGYTIFPMAELKKPIKYSDQRMFYKQYKNSTVIVTNWNDCSYTMI